MRHQYSNTQNAINALAIFLVLALMAQPAASQTEYTPNLASNPDTVHVAPLSEEREQLPHVHTRMLEVDGHPMRVQTAGWNHRVHGQPIVVFQNGAGTPVEAWEPVLAEVAGFAPVIAYDRSGIGESPWDEQPPTPQHVNQKLRMLLEKIGAEPPYVLVGFSWGGPLIEHFAGEWPDEVAGLVFIDSRDLTVWNTIDLAALRDIGAGEAEREAFYRAIRKFLEQAPDGIRAEGTVIMELIETAAAEETNLTGYDVPMALLVAGRYQVQPPLEVSFDLEAFWEASLRHILLHLNDVVLKTPEAILTVASNARHYMHGDDPALVIDAIRRVSFPDPIRQLHASLDSGGEAAVVVRYHELKGRYPAGRFHENLLNSFGYELLHAERVAEAIAIFELNVAEYPNAPNPYDSLGDAYSAVNRLEEAKASYRRAVDLAEASEDPRLAIFRENLEQAEQLLLEQ